MNIPHHVVMFSGGVASWAAAKRVAERHGTGRMVLLFADTLMEDGDLYRFLSEAAENVGAPLVKICEGRTPWQVFEDERYVGNTRVDPCSRILKRQMLDKWRNENCDPDVTTLYVGYDIEEQDRLDRLLPRVAPWRYEAPMTDKPYIPRLQMLEWLRREGIEPPRLYELGFPHNNCGGFCVKAGQSHFIHLLKMLPDRYAQHEQQEQRMIETLGPDAAILRDRRGGDTKPLSLKKLRERYEKGRTMPLFEWGGCGCAFGEE